MKEKAIVEKVYCHQPQKNVPTLLKFQNGSLATINKDTQYCRMKKNNNSKAAMVVASGQVYHGLIGVDDGVTEQQTDLYVCVRSKSTNKVRILPIEQVCLINNIYSELSKTRIDNISKETALKKMLKQFGGRSASRYLSRQENLKMDIDLFKDELDATVQETIITEDDDKPLMDDKHLDSIRPKCNKDAKLLADVYDVNDVVPLQLLERLEEESNAVYSTSLEKIPINSEYLKKCIERLQNGTPVAASYLKIKLIIYMDCLLNLINTRMRSMKKCELSRITERVENDVRTRFCDPNSKNFMRTALYSEKALCYFIVLALLISDNYELDVNILMQELRCPRQKIMRYAHIVNARSKAKSDVLSLRLPGKMPPLPTLGKRQRIN